MPTTDAVKSYNEQRLKLISPSIRSHVAAIIKDMEYAGWQPMIDSGVYRTPAEQAKKKAQGYSKLSYGFHNVTDKDGTPASLAADIVDARFLWKDTCPRKYWMQLAAAAENQGLQTGIYFGLSRRQKDAIHTALGEKMWDANVTLGWDTAHVEPWQWRYPLFAVKLGVRPKLGEVKPFLFKPAEPVLVINGTIIKGAYLLDGHWYCTAEELARAVGAGTYYTGQTTPVAVALTQWGFGYITNNRISTRNRFDITAKLKTKKEGDKS